MYSFSLVGFQRKRLDPFILAHNCTAINSIYGAIVYVSENKYAFEFKLKRDAQTKSKNNKMGSSLRTLEQYDPVQKQTFRTAEHSQSNMM